MGQGENEGLRQKAEGVFGDWKRKIQNSDWVDKARDEVDKARTEVEDLAKKQDWKGIAKDAGKALAQNGGQVGVGDIVGGAMFPQGAIAKYGAGAATDFVSKRQARELLNDPAQLGQRMVADFDSLDTNKNSYIEGTDLQQSGGKGLLDSISGIFDKKSSAPVAAILDKGYSKFAAFDGEDADKGVSKEDVALFNLVQSEKSIKEAVGSEAKSWGIGGAIGGGGLGLAATLCLGGRGGLMRSALQVVAPAVVVGGAAYAFKHSTSDSYYNGKKDEAEKLIEWLKKEL